MKVSDLLESRRMNWRELEKHCTWMEGGSRRKIPPGAIVRFSALYRAACADLALADAYQLPPGTIHYLHHLVGRAHNQLYRTRTFNVAAWFRELFVLAPQRLFNDNCLRLAFAIFWGLFLLSGAMAYHSPEFSQKVIGKGMMDGLDEMYAEPVEGRNVAMGGFMAGYYIWNNPSIGLRCFALGMLGGIGGLYETARNAAILGAAFGYMARSPNAENFFHFVTAHGPFELTAIVLAAGAGMRLGFSLVDTKGYTRRASLRLAAYEATPTVCASILLFVAAAFIEGFISPSALPYEFKAAVAVMSAAVLMFYFVVLGFPRGDW